MLESWNPVLYLQGSYWTMDGPPGVSQARGPKRPFPEEEEERKDVRYLLFFFKLLLFLSACVKPWCRTWPVVLMWIWASAFTW